MHRKALLTLYRFSNIKCTEKGWNIQYVNMGIFQNS